MQTNGKKVFSAERRQQAGQNKNASIGDAITAISDLKGDLQRDFQSHFDRLCEKLDVVVEDEKSTSVNEIMAEIHAMNEHIALTKQEIAALKPVDDANTTITVATEELGEVVKATEEATNIILESAEAVDEIANNIRNKIPEGDPDTIEPEVERLAEHSREILTACGFQDLTGQRITKVVNALNYIEERLAKMIEIWRIETGTADVRDVTFAKDDEREDKDMLHGPQGEGGGGMAQDDIDALFD